MGGNISDTATVAGGVNPTGTMTFTAYGPNDPTCVGTPAFSSTTTVTGNGAYPSASFTTALAGAPTDRGTRGAAKVTTIV